MTELQDPPDAPRSFGPYHLLQCLGEGAMGQVWLADQTAPVRRQVAIKLIKSGMDTRQVVARFESEFQALALMNHEAIAKVYDGGSTPQGRPYFVMEYVSGVSLTEHCDRHRLSIAARLELLREVCAGVEHAHQKAILHRDLKPSNILVASSEGEARPKIIDFGIAKAISGRRSGDSLDTALGTVVGTPEYMSPEQAAPTGEDVDTRTDVYSLGVILYELLTGALPFDGKALQRSELADPPPRPSQRLRLPTPVTPEAAHARGTTTADLRALLEGDLDAITLKALEPDRARRYATPSELAADLLRFLRKEPVLARPPSVAYRARRYAQRHLPLAIGTAALFASLFAGGIVSGVAAVRAVRAERHAEAEAAVARATSDFLENDLLGQAGASARPDPALKLRTLLDRAAGSIEGKFSQQPVVEASIRGAIGEAYHGLGLYPEAHKQLSRALEVDRAALGPDHPRTLRAASNFAILSLDEGARLEAEAILGRTYAQQRRVLGLEHADTLHSLVGHARSLCALEKRAQAEVEFLQAVELQRRVLGAEHRETLQTMYKLAANYAVVNKPAQAERLFREVVDAQRRVLGAEHPDTLTSMYAQSVSLMNFERPAEAVAVLDEVLPILRRLLGPEHPKTIQALRARAVGFMMQSRFAEAEAGLRESLALSVRVLGPEQRESVITREYLGALYLDWGRYAQAEVTLEESNEALHRLLGPEALSTLDGLEALASVYSAQGRFEKAAAMSEQALAVRHRTLAPEHRDTLLNEDSLAAIYALQGRLAEAEAIQVRLQEPLRRVVGADADGTLQAMAHLAQTWAWRGDAERAGVLFEQALEADRRVFGARHPRTLTTLDALGSFRSGQRQYDQAKAALEEALAGRRQLLGATHPLTLDTLANLALVQHQRGDFAASVSLAREAVLANRTERPQTWQRWFSESLLGAGLAAQNKRAEAQPLLRAGARGMQSCAEHLAVPERARLDQVREWLRAASK